MSLPYKYVSDAAVLGFFASCTHRERNELLRLFLALAESPHEHGAWRRRSNLERDLFVKRSGRWLVTYWPDDATSELRIVSVEKVRP